MAPYRRDDLEVAGRSVMGHDPGGMGTATGSANRASRGGWARRSAILGAMLGIVLYCGLGIATAQTASETAGAATAAEGGAVDWAALTVAERRDLLARLSDKEVRALVGRQLDQAATAPQAASQPASMAGGIQAELHLVRTNLGHALAQIGNLPSVPGFALAKLTEGKEPSHIFLVLLGLALMVAAGSAAEWLFCRSSGSIRRQLEGGGSAGLGAKIGNCMARLVLDLFAVAIFVVAAIGLFFALYQGHEPSRAFITTYFGALVMVRLAAVGSRFLLAPAAPGLRLVPFDDDLATSVHRSIVWFAVFTSFGPATINLLALFGLDVALHTMVRLLLVLVIISLLIGLIWHARRGIAAVIRGGPAEDAIESQAKRIFAETWHILASAYVIGVAGFTVIGALAGRPVEARTAVGSLLIVVAVPLASAGLGRLLIGLLATIRGRSGDTDAPAEYEQVLHKALRVVLLLTAVVVLLRIWGLDIFSAAGQGVGAAIVRPLLDIGFTLLVAYVGWTIAKTAIDRRLAEEGAGASEAEKGGEGGGKGASRLKTLLPLFRRFLQITICVMAGMIVLSSLGVDIGPLIAGAGVVGLAIGFGAQTLVKDIFSGVFFLVDDAFRIGEYVDIGQVKGTVESINVRSLVLRHHRGPLHTVPFGEIAYLTNYSRDWAIMKLEFRVTYDTDINKVKKIFKKIGKDMLEHEELGQHFLEPLKSQGAKAMEDSAMILRAKFMAVPGEQFTIRKEIYSRVQQAFKENGIEFAHRRVTVDLPPSVDPKSPKGEELAAAAAAAVAGEKTKTAR